MADITQIRAKVETADVQGATSYSWVYLGIAGREFVLDSGSGDDFVQGAKVCFVLGEQDNDDNHEQFKVTGVQDAEWNDPRKPQLDTEDLDAYPVYLRFEESGSEPPWCLERVRVTVKARSGPAHHFDNLRLEKKEDSRRIWFDQKYGKQLYLRRVQS